MAVSRQRCVVIFAARRRRSVAPHAIGVKNGRLKLLAFQYSGGSVSGLAKDGGWRTFLLDEIFSAEIVNDAWHSAPDYLIKLETSFDTVQSQVPHVRRPAAHAT